MSGRKITTVSVYQSTQRVGVSVYKTRDPQQLTAHQVESRVLVSANRLRDYIFRSTDRLPVLIGTFFLLIDDAGHRLQIDDAGHFLLISEVAA